MKILSVILAVALVAVSGRAIHLSREAEAGRQRIASLDALLQARQAELAALTNTPVARPATGLQLPEPATAQPVTRESSTEAAPPAIRLPDIATLQAQMSSPEALALRRETTRLLMRTSNPDVDEALGLAPEELDKLLELLATQQDRSSALFAAVTQASDPAAAQRELAAEREEQRRTSEAELQALLGSRYPQWQDYQQTRPAWQQRRNLRAVLDAAGTPMTDSQGRALIAALSAEQLSINQTRLTSAQPFSQNTPERHQRLMNAAAPHLSAQQLESYRQMLDRAAVQEATIMAPFREAAEAAAAR